MKEVTIIHIDGSNVGLGVLELTGTKNYHVRYVKDALQGGVELSEKLTEIPIEDVEVADGFDYGALIDFQDRNRAVLLWRGSRQTEINTVREKAMAGVEAKVVKEMKVWDRANPEPTGPIPVAAQEGEAFQENQENLESPEIPETPETLNSPEEGPGSTADLCASIYQGFPCELANDHEGKHVVEVDGGKWEWVTEDEDQPDDDEDEVETPSEDEQEPIENFQRPTDPPTPEETQETVPSASKCMSMFGTNECMLPADHDEMHSTTTDATDGEAPRWNDEQQDAEIPF